MLEIQSTSSVGRPAVYHDSTSHR